MLKFLEVISVGILTALMIEQAPRVAGWVLLLWRQLVCKKVRERLYMDWLADLYDTDGNVSKLLFAVKIGFNIPSLWKTYGPPDLNFRAVAFAAFNLNLTALTIGMIAFLVQYISHGEFHKYALFYNLTYWIPILLMPLFIPQTYKEIVKTWREGKKGEAIWSFISQSAFIFMVFISVFDHTKSIFGGSGGTLSGVSFGISTIYLTVLYTIKRASRQANI